MKTAKDVRVWLQGLAKAQVEGVWSVRPMIRVGREDLLRAIEVLKPFADLPDPPKPGGVTAIASLESALEYLGVQDGGVKAKIMELVAERARFGVAKYGVPLSEGDGRDTFKDLKDEAGDLWHYTGKAIQERQLTAEQWDELHMHAAELARVFRDMAWCERAGHPGPPRLAGEGKP